MEPSDNSTHSGQATEDADLSHSEIDIPKPKVDKGKGKAKPRPTVMHRGVRKTILTKAEAIELGLICLKCDKSAKMPQDDECAMCRLKAEVDESRWTCLKLLGPSAFELKEDDALVKLRQSREWRQKMARETDKRKHAQAEEKGEAQLDKDQY